MTGRINLKTLIFINLYWFSVGGYWCPIVEIHYIFVKFSMIWINNVYVLIVVFF